MPLLNENKIKLYSNTYRWSIFDCSNIIATKLKYQLKYTLLVYTVLTDFVFV